MSNAQDIPVWEKYTLTIEEEKNLARLLFIVTRSMSWTL